ncbi:MAG: hypothetical protein A07HR60_02310 [uncultured archaeon A07HR60]|nr:MAG: hypothetical protein A07HR60_02310 [uncultured archaeon A07HR60]
MAVVVVDANILIDYKDTSPDTRHERAENIISAIDRGDLPTARVTNYRNIGAKTPSSRSDRNTVKRASREGIQRRHQLTFTHSKQLSNPTKPQDKGSIIVTYSYS